MQIDGGGERACTYTHTCKQQNGGRGRQIKRWHSHVSLSVTHILLLHKYTCIHMDKRMGFGELPQPVSHTGSQQQWHRPQLTSHSFSHPLVFTSHFFLLWKQLSFGWISFDCPLCPPLHLTATWISLGHSFQWKMLSRSRNVVSGPPIRLVRVGCLPRAQQVQSWNYEPQSR